MQKNGWTLIKVQLYCTVSFQSVRVCFGLARQKSTNKHVCMHARTHSHTHTDTHTTSLLSPQYTGFTRLVCRQGLVFCLVFICLRVCMCVCVRLNLPATHTHYFSSVLRGSGEPGLQHTHTHTHNARTKIKY